MLRHVTPTGIRLLRGYFVGQVGAAVVGENAHQPLAPDQTRADVAVTLILDLVEQVLKNSLALFVRHEPKGQREHAGSLRSVGVLALPLIEKSAGKSLL